MTNVADKLRPRTLAARIALGYALISLTYVLVSDRVVSWLTQDVETLVLINSTKGTAFVAVTSVFLYLMVLSSLQRTARIFEKYVSSKKEIEKVSFEHMATVERLAFSDVLTGLPNRARLNVMLREELDAGKGHFSSGALIFLDMDDLKIVNDTFGHSYGDAMIITAGMHLVGVVDQVAGPSYVFRLGGDEFIVFLPGFSDRLQISQLADELVQTLSREYQVKDACFHASASVGIALYPDDGTTAEELLKNADAALHAAKQRGKSCRQFYQPAMQQEALKKIVITNQLRHAIEKNELTLHFQPQLSLASSSIVSFEALLRWHNPPNGNIPPSEFIPLAEKSGLIEPIGEWVMKEAAQFAGELVALGHSNIRVAVNVSPRQLAANSFVDMACRTIEIAGVAAGQIELEVTESVLIEPMEENVQKLEVLHNAGHRLALDDFGTGYSSLTYLRQLPVDIVKIDKSFIDRLDDDPSQPAMIAALVTMAHVLGLTVVAEGVETARQLEQIRECGCDIVQGYFISRPVPKDKALAML